MSLDLQAIHAALAQQIVDNVERAINGYGFDPGESRDYPCVVIDPSDPWVEYHKTFGANAECDVQVTATVYVAASEEDQRLALADFASDGTSATSSIRAAIESDRTLGGVVDDCVCDQASPPRNADPGVMAVSFAVRISKNRG